jgi:hypothetical protein
MGGKLLAPGIEKIPLDAYPGLIIAASFTIVFLFSPGDS